MSGMLGFCKKEIMEVVRSKKAYLALLLFLLFGILNPAMAKLTPFLLQYFSKSFREQGITMTKVSVNALTSWQQYYKNMPVELLVFLLLFAGIITMEYQNKTFILMVTKGLKKSIILATKVLCLFCYFSVCYWMAFGVTYAYNAYYWDNSIALHVLFSAGCYYLFGLFLLCVLVFFSTVFDQSMHALLGVLFVILLCYLLEFFDQTKSASPITLLAGMGLLLGKVKVHTLYLSVATTTLTSCLMLLISLLHFQKREL